MFDLKIDYTKSEFGKRLLIASTVCDIANSSSYRESRGVSIGFIKSRIIQLEKLTGGMRVTPFTVSYENLDTLNEREILTYFNETCGKVMELLKDRTIREIQPLLVKKCVDDYLSKTPIGGKEKRGFDPSEIVEFVSQSDAFRFKVRDSIIFSKGQVFVKGSKDDCSIFDTIVMEWQTIMLKRKMDQIEQKESDMELERLYKEELETNLRDYELSKQKQITTSGRVCIDRCKKNRDFGTCTCKTAPYKWYGVDYNWDYCNDKDCSYIMV